ncbi:hypothetical protein FPOAC2_05411 [Fusarium poae]|jgi:hypothetical protein
MVRLDRKNKPKISLYPWRTDEAAGGDQGIKNAARPDLFTFGPNNKEPQFNYTMGLGLVVSSVLNKIYDNSLDTTIHAILISRSSFKFPPNGFRMDLHHPLQQRSLSIT